MMTMVGDAYAGPLVAELRARRYDLSSLYAIGTGGAATNPKYKRALMECLPHVTIIEGYGSSESGNMAFGHSRDGNASETFQPRVGATVVSADRSRFLQPGERGDRLGPPGPGGFRSDTSTMPRPPNGPSRRSMASEW